MPKVDLLKPGAVLPRVPACVSSHYDRGSYYHTVELYTILCSILFCHFESAIRKQREKLRVKMAGVYDCKSINIIPSFLTIPPSLHLQRRG